MPDLRKLLLVVEDERALASALETKLSHEGFEAKNATSGEDALKLVRSEKFDLMILDLVMANIDGFHVLETMRKEGIHIPTIVLSNLGGEEVREKVIKLGALDLLLKAETPMSKVVERVQQLLGSDGSSTLSMPTQSQPSS